MTAFARYAVYFMPRPGSPLLERAAHWLGRDALSGLPLERPPVEGLGDLSPDRLTAGPRHYGFHATLKAPFEPVPDLTPGDAVRRVRAFAAGRTPFEIRLEVAPLGRFLALRLVRPSPEMTDLHWACVRELDALRAPISNSDVVRRRRAGLSEEEDANLLQWGYPYIFEGFRFHMTLTSRVTCRESLDSVRDALAAHFAPVLADPVPVDGVALFAQLDREAPFTVLDWCPFGADAGADAGASARADADEAAPASGSARA